jgi:hypothetical protein
MVLGHRGKPWIALVALATAAGCASPPASHQEPVTDRVGGGVRVTLEGGVGRSPRPEPLPVPAAQEAPAAGPWYPPAPSPNHAAPGTGFLENGPSISGTQLNLVPGHTATERALELTQKLADANADNDRLSAQVAQLESLRDQNELAIREATEDIRATRDELVGAREELEHRRGEIAALEQKLRDEGEENTSALETALALLQQLEMRLEGGDRGKPAEPKGTRPRPGPSRVGQK